MTNQFSIEYISGLLARPSTISGEDRVSVDAFLHAYPYFVPLRYVAAIEKYRDQPFSPEMLTNIQPYLGNWIRFCDVVTAAGQAPEVSVHPIQDATNEDVLLPVQPEPEVDEPELVAKEEETEPVPTQETSVQPEPQQEEPIASMPQDNEVTPQAQETTPPVVGVSEEFLRMIREEVPEPQAEKEIPAGSELSGNFEDKIAPEELPVAEAQPLSAAVSEEKVHIQVIPANVDSSAAAAPVSVTPEDEADLISPIYTQDYYLQQGERISEDIPAVISDLVDDLDDEDRSLMVVMSFSEWLLHFKSTKQKKEEEKKDQRALRTMWQKEKLAAAMEEENEEIPENVFEMAVNSIAKEDGLASESLADIYIKQGKYEKAIDMYRKLSLRNPQKNAYFALKIEEVLKEKQS